MKEFNLSITSCVFLCCLSFNGYTASTDAKLNQLEKQLLHLKKQLFKDEDSRKKTYRDLAKTEKKTSEHLHQLHQLTIQEQETKQAIQSLNQTIESLNQQLKKQEITLANHVRARHLLGTAHPWQWLLHQETSHTLSRLYVFYYYLFQADQKIIQQVRETHAHLSKNKIALLKQQNELLTLQQNLVAQQKHLALMKQQQQTLLKTLNQTIQSKHEQLKTFREDKTRLQALLKKLSLRPKKQRRFATILNLEGKHLKSPLKTPSKQTKPLNQGIVFLANEGTPVVSILPGKVIFSDWLKGYGLLLIIEHDNDVMSLYAHNASLFKSLGASVKQGEQIATVGHTGGLRENGLYFEVRRRGRAVPPREWMS
jgi:murein hydrolase activator